MSAIKLKMQPDEPSKKRTLRPKSHLTIPLISMAHLPTLTCKVLGEPYIDQKITALGKDTKTAPTVILVLNLDTNQEALLVVNTLIASAFERAGSPLTGRYFQFLAKGIRDGKNYRDIDVTEMEWDDDQLASTEASDLRYDEEVKRING
jgi:hypothetical protein